MSEMHGPLPGWAPRACRLPTAEQPVRVAEFDELFATAVRSVTRVEPSRLRLALDPDAAVAARTADLAVRETACCSFFAFTLSAAGGRLLLEIGVPAGQVGVLDALAERASAGRRP
jgi:hypothetical protein